MNSKKSYFSDDEITKSYEKEAERYCNFEIFIGHVNKSRSKFFKEIVTSFGRYLDKSAPLLPVKGDVINFIFINRSRSLKRLSKAIIYLDDFVKWCHVFQDSICGGAYKDKTVRRIIRYLDGGLSWTEDTTITDVIPDLDDLIRRYEKLKEESKK